MTTNKKRARIVDEGGSIRIYPAETMKHLQPILGYLEKRSTDYDAPEEGDEPWKTAWKKRNKPKIQTTRVLLAGEEDSPEGKCIVTYDGFYDEVTTILTKAGYEISHELERPARSFRMFKGWDKGLRPEQRDAVLDLLSVVGTKDNPGPSGGMVEADTGIGKTYIIAALCRVFRKRILITTRKKTVVDRLYKGLKEILAPDGISVGMRRGGVDIDGDVIVSTTTMLRNYDPDDTDVLIFDECHNATATETSESVMRYGSSVRFGLSGTITGRFDGREKLLNALFGPLVKVITPMEAESLGRVCPIKAYFLTVAGGPPLSDYSSPITKERHGIWFNKYRNSLVAKVAEMVPPDQQLLIFVKSKMHGKELLKMLPGYEFFHGGLSEREYKRLLGGFESGEIKRIISTDSMSEGVDPSHLMVLIDANWVTSRVSLAQKVGRNRRVADGKEWGVVVNFMDDFDPGAHAKAWSRINTYSQRGFEMKLHAKTHEIEFVTTKIKEDETNT